MPYTAAVASTDLTAGAWPSETVTDLLVAVDRVVAGQGHAAAPRAWQTFRLVGAPDTRIG